MGSVAAARTLMQALIDVLCQVIDLARILLRKTRSLDQASGGLHHLSPLAGALGAVATRLGLAPVTERDLLFCMWTFLEVRGMPLRSPANHF